jgi:hypothetical protein
MRSIAGGIDEFCLVDDPVDFFMSGDKTQIRSGCSLLQAQRAAGPGYF